MPYFVYQITEPKNFQLLQQCDNYKQARELARNSRAELIANGQTQPQPQPQIRMIFARNDAEAIKLLSAPREQRYMDEG
jgi:hypothetical protein